MYSFNLNNILDKTFNARFKMYSTNKNNSINVQYGDSQGKSIQLNAGS